MPQRHTAKKNGSGKQLFHFRFQYYDKSWKEDTFDGKLQAIQSYANRAFILPKNSETVWKKETTPLKKFATPAAKDETLSIVP